MLDKWLVPRVGLIVRDPRTKQILDSKGEWKPFIGPEGRYWRRRFKCGDVLIGNPPVIKEKIIPKKKIESRVSEQEK